MGSKMTKIVLIGGPSCGKSTLIEMLSRKGYNTIPEVAKDLILKRGLINPRDKQKYSQLQDEIALEQTRRENILYNEDTTFLDRGIHDNIAYCEKYLGLIPDLTKKLISEHKGYDRIFFLERLPFVKKNFRIENDESEAIELHNRILKVYQNLGYNLEKIPALPKEERLNYLLERVK